MTLLLDSRGGKWKVVLPKSLILVVFISGCASFNPQPDRHGILISQAGRPVESETMRQLKALPAPTGKISAAVYGFSDQTGQNKPSPASGFSKAVTQGASNMLVKALLDSLWFTPVERSGLQNLLTERSLWDLQIASSSSEGGTRLAPLPPARVIFEGGIIAYETNVRTGGYGAKYLGIGGSQRYREDSVMVNLRVVNAQDGGILYSVNSSKRIYSTSVNYGFFGYTGFDKIAELESGFAFNEPAQQGVEEAIQSALVDIIVKGILNSSWGLKDERQISDPAFTRFLSEDELNRFLRERGIEVDGISNDTETTENISSSTSSGEQQTGARRAPSVVNKFSDGGLNELPNSRVTTNGDADDNSVADGLVGTAASSVAQKDVTLEKQEELRPSVRSEAEENPANAASEQPSGPIMNLYVSKSMALNEASVAAESMSSRLDKIEIALLRIGESEDYRIRLGPIRSASEAQLAFTELQRMGFDNVDVEQIDR